MDTRRSVLLDGGEAILAHPRVGRPLRRSGTPC